VLLFPLIAAILPAQATTYGQRLPMDTMLNHSEQVVRGEVAEVTPEWADDGLIWTVVTLDVEETLERTAATQVQFRVPGGTVGDLSLAVPGAPSFQLGQDVLVFLDGDRLRGFGQGAFLVQEGVAWRGLGNELEANPTRRPLTQLMGDMVEAKDCIRTRSVISYEKGWSLRGTAGTRMAADDEKAFSLTLMEGMQYRLDLCGDANAGPLDLVLYDTDGRELAWETGPAGQTELLFRPESTGQYFVAIVNESLASDALRTSVVLSISYR